MQKVVQVEMVPSYTLTINGEKVPGFVKTSTWEGFAKFEHETFGTVILSTFGPGWDSSVLSEVISRIFGDPEEPATMQVMKVSPLILDLMKTLGIEEQGDLENADTVETEEL